MAKVKSEPHWPRISSIPVFQNFLPYPLSCFSPKIHLKDLWKYFKFDLDQNLDHRAEIVMQAILKLECIFDLEMPLNDGETRPDYPRPPCAPSFFKSGLIHILQQYFTHSLYVYVGQTIMPPRILASGPKPAGAIISSYSVEIRITSFLKSHW